MGIFDAFTGKKQKVDPEVEAAERRAYEKEIEIVHRDKKRKAVEEAGRKGIQRARGINTGTPTEKKAAKVGKTLIGAGQALWKAGQYGATLNWGGQEAYPPQVPATRPVPVKKGRKKGGKKGKKQKKQHKAQQQDPFAMPQFPF